MPGPTKYMSLDPVTGGHKEYAIPTVSAGAASAGLPIGLNAQGQIDPSAFPPQLGLQTGVVQASEAIAAGAFVNVYDMGGGVFRVRNADAATAKVANGFVRAAVASGANAIVDVDGVNDALAGLVPGKYFLGATGGITQTLPSGTGTLLQPLGYAISATQLEYQPGQGTILA